jgi:hypothetical protein
LRSFARAARYRTFALCSARRRKESVVSAEPVTARRLGIGLAVAAVLLTSACAAGQQAATANARPTLDGANAEIGPINIRGTVIEPPSGSALFYPVGSDLPVTVVLVNNGTKADQLTSITSPMVTNWSASSASTPVSIDPGARTSWGTPESKNGQLLLTHTKKKLYPGSTIPVTFSFANAGKVTFAVPVGLSSSPPSSVIPEPTTSSIER